MALFNIELDLRVSILCDKAIVLWVKQIRKVSKQLVGVNII